LVDEGAAVLAVDLGADGLATTADEASRPGAVSVLAGDVTDPDLAPAAVAAALAIDGRLDLLVNGAGILRFEHSHEADLDAFERVVAVNLTGTFRCCRAAIPALLDGGGAIVNVASTSATFGHPWAAAYASSKGGVVSLTLVVARDLAARLIRCCTIAPGTFDTPMLALLPEDARQALADQIPHPRRLGKPSEFAALVQHIVENPALNGETIRLDGALRMPPK
jgi:NAD(P)-dependent dehydrogenase (short-subunit alcohol dehydrogenase family)